MRLLSSTQNFLESANPYNNTESQHPHSGQTSFTAEELERQTAELSQKISSYIVLKESLQAQLDRINIQNTANKKR